MRIENTGLVLTNGYHRFGQGSEFTFPQGASVPHLSTMAHNTNETWALPQSSGADFPLYGAAARARGPGGAAQPARFFLQCRVAWCPRVKLRSSICLCWILQNPFLPVGKLCPRPRREAIGAMSRAPAPGGRDREAGVTLTEVLVALVLFALIGGAGLAVLDQVLRVQARTDGRLERLAEVQRAMHLLTLDFMQATGGSLGSSDGAVAFRRSGGPGGMAVRYGLDGADLTRSVSGSSGEARQVVLSGVDAARWQFYAPRPAGPTPGRPTRRSRRPIRRRSSLWVRLAGPGLSGELRRIALLPAEVAP